MDTKRRALLVTWTTQRIEGDTDRYKLVMTVLVPVGQSGDRIVEEFLSLLDNRP